jgi:hypothetical protein
MAGEKNAGSIVYEISADVEPLLQGGKQAIDVWINWMLQRHSPVKEWTTSTRARPKPDPRLLNWLVMPTHG